MTTVIVDYNSGNLHSAEKSFQRMAQEVSAGKVVVSSDPDAVAAADRIVLPGVGAFADCRAGLASYPGLFDAMQEAVIIRAVPFLGICVGMQMMASRGLEHGLNTPGFDWIKGEVVALTPSDPTLKIPHMGWNDLVIDTPHPVLDGIKTGDNVYFVHSYHLAANDPSQRLAHCDYGGEVTAMVGCDNFIGTQFHPEKSQSTGLRLIGNFLLWKP
ncbi:MAG: imidazole glycerol phosphate synthase subunit HisH [Proteobacteria bacterium]|nr:imidazole glycerol phosphate synthase subunit HisH [Pseudomonadota bacterium]MDA1285612.1 imidazole glycerol phosphate synthase subunit HisH [Pseudomonadota bacterium]